MSRPRISGEARRLQQLATFKLKQYRSATRLDDRLMREAQRLLVSAMQVEREQAS